MGNVIATLCRTCGFKNEFNLGGGKFSYRTNQPVPAINKDTLAFENPNYYEHEKSGKYLFYSDGTLKGENSNGKVINNSKLTFNEEGNYCPSCRNKALAFRVIVYYD